MPIPLSNAMHIMCHRAITLVRDGNLTSDDHCDLCHKIAQEFELYDSEGMFPVWLSRVLDGIIRDVASGETSV